MRGTPPRKMRQMVHLCLIGAKPPKRGATAVNTGWTGISKQGGANGVDLPKVSLWKEKQKQKQLRSLVSLVLNSRSSLLHKAVEISLGHRSGALAAFHSF